LHYWPQTSSWHDEIIAQTAIRNPEFGIRNRPFGRVVYMTRTIGGRPTGNGTNQRLCTSPRARQALPWLAAAAAAFFLGRHLARHSADFIVYYRAARSLIAGRTDLYSNTFSWGPPMIYVYPPLFLLLIFPIGYLSFANAFGLWFALMVLATAAVVRRTYYQWRPQSQFRYVWLLIALPGPYTMWSLKYGNAQVFVVLLTILAVLAWCSGNLWKSSFMLALGGVIKIFPLFLTPVFLARREWGLAARVAGISCVLWLLPALYFGPRRSVGLYQSWYRVVVRDTQGYRKKRALDESLTGITQRWFSHVDYSRYKDRAFPQVDVENLPGRAIKLLIVSASAAILGLSLWMCARLRSAEVESQLPARGAVRSRVTGTGPNAEIKAGATEMPTTHKPCRGYPSPSSAVQSSGRNASVATAASIFITAQIFLGPYTAFLYPSSWLLVALALPVITAGRKRLGNLFLGVATFNALLFAVPGSANQRTLQAWGAFSFVGFFLWVLLMWCG
jgi:hypothetical protein